MQQMRQFKVTMRIIDELLVEAAGRAGIKSVHSVVLRARDEMRAKEAAIGEFHRLLIARGIRSAGRIDFDVIEL
jgi:hypothetical protein